MLEMVTRSWLYIYICVCVGFFFCCMDVQVEAEAQNVLDPSEASEAELENHRLANLVQGLIDRKVTSIWSYVGEQDTQVRNHTWMYRDTWVHNHTLCAHLVHNHT